MRRWFITGGSRGLGRAFTQAALDRGDRVAITSRRPGSLEALVERYGDAVVPLTLDLTDASAIEPTFEEAAAKLGHIDVVVNNAGYLLIGALEETSDAEIRALFETLLFGPMFVTRAAVRHMRPR